MFVTLEKFFRKWVSFLMKFYPLVIILGIAIAGLSMPNMISLFKNISTDPIDLLPKDYPSVQSLRKIRKKFNPKKRLGIILESPNPSNTLRLVEAIQPIIQAHPLVGRAYIEKVAFDYFDKNKLLFLDLEDLGTIRDRIDRKIQREKLGGFYISFEDEEDEEKFEFSDLKDKYGERFGDPDTNRYFVSPNGLVFGVFAESRQSNLDIKQEIKFQNALMEMVKNFPIQDYDPEMKMYISGSSRILEYRALLRDLKIAGAISGILIFLPLLLRFRRPQYVFLIFFPLALGIPTGLALSTFWIQKLNVTTSFLFAILGGLGVETGIHLFSRYYEERKSGRSVADCILDLYVKIGRPVFTAVATLAVTFLLMIINDFRGFSEFGLISGIGLWTVFFFYFTFFPALLILSEKIKLLKIGQHLKEFESAFRFSPTFIRTLSPIFLLFTIFSLAMLPQIQFEYDFKKIRADQKELRVAKRKQRMTSGKRVNKPAVIMIHNEAQAQQLKAVVKDWKAENPDTVLEGSTSIYSLVPKKQKEKLLLVEEMQEMLADDSIKLVKGEKKKDLDDFKLALNRTSLTSFAEVPQKLIDAFQGDPKIPGTLFYIYAKPRLEMDNGLNALAFARELESLKIPPGLEAPSSDSVVFAGVISTMFRDSKKVLMIAVLSLMFFVYIDFRDLKKTGLVMFSIITGILWVGGVMYLAGIRLNLYNMIMLPAIMGMSIDNSIHIYHRYEELGPGSLSKVMSTTGIAAILASVTNAAGFIGLTFCSHGGLRSMGVVACIGLATSLVTTLVFLPMILHYLEERNGAGEERAGNLGSEKNKTFLSPQV